LDKNQPPKTLVLSEGTAAYVLDLASRAAEAVERARSSDEQKDSTFSLSSEPDGEEVSQADAARVTLRACLGVLRAVTEREVRPALAQTPGDDVASLCAMGMPRLLLGLLASLPVPEGAGNSEKKKKASGPSAAPDLAQTTFLPSSDEASSTAQSLAEKLREGHNPYPSSRPWDGYRVDALAPLANAMFGRPAVCDAVYDLGGVPVLLACTRGEDGDEYLREYALWAVRNVCAGSESARLEIEAMQPRAAADAHELAAAGLRVAVDPVTGRVKIGNVANDARNVNRFAKETEKGVSGAGSLERGSETVPNGPTRDSGIGGRLMLSGGGERARTPVGRAIQAALEAGLEPTPENDDEDAEVPKHWKIADLS
jgi:ataxin-10